MQVKELDAVLHHRGVQALLVLLNIPFVRLLANMVAVASPWEFGRVYSIQLAGVILAVVVTIIRWKPIVGVIVNGVVLLIALIALFWSQEPLNYLAYVGFLLLAVIALYALSYALTRRSRAQRAPRNGGSL